MVRIQAGGFFGAAPYRLSFRFQAAPAVAGAPSLGPDPAAGLARRLLDLRGRLDGLREASGARGASAGAARVRRPAAAVSGTPLVVTTAGSPSTLATGGLVGPPTAPNGLVKGFAGGSSAQATLDGAYDGSLGAQVDLTFVVTKGGTLGVDDTEVAVLDDQGNLLDELMIDKETPGESFQLGVGIQVTFTAGALVEDDSFTLSLSTAGGVVDPDQVLRGSGLPGSGSYQTDFDGPSTATATLGGTYLGAFDDTLQFVVSKAGIVGLNDVEIEVFDGGGTKIDTLQFDRELAPGTELSLSNGLTLALSGGALLRPDGFDVAVRADDQVVFGDGQRVQAGTFVLNGTSIVLEALDTIRTLADKISNSDAGVTASFDTATGEFRLTREDDGPGAIQLGADDTGFFAAVGLEQSALVPGTNAGTFGVTQLSELPGLSSGTFSIDGLEVAVDVENDTIDDVLARINALDTDVQATFVGNRLRLQSNEAFELQEGTSGFFGAVAIQAGVYEPTERVVGSRRGRIGDEHGLERSLQGLRQSLEQVLRTGSDPRLPGFGQALGQAVRDTFQAGDGELFALNSGLGLRFQLQGTTELLSIDPDSLDQALARRPDELADFLWGASGDEPDSGLVGRLSSAVDRLLEQLATRLDPLQDGGLLLDLRG